MNRDYLNVYVATKLYSFFDRKVSGLLCEAINKSSRFKNANIYLPYRDSNMKVDSIENVAHDIFLADIAAMEQIDCLICRLDGLSYDAGVGFEIGYCLAKEVPIVVFTTDFMKTKIHNKSYRISMLIEKMTTVFRYEYCNNFALTYEEEMDNNIDYFVEYVRNMLDYGEFSRKKLWVLSRLKKDVFIDICGCKYEWSNFIADRIKDIVKSLGLTFWVSNRYSVDYDIEKEVAALNNSDIFIICYDENEPDLDSCILQGYAYYKGKKIVGYETNKVVFYVEGKQQMGVNFMLEQSCDLIARGINDIKTCILKLIRGRNEE